jgi:hypothetical protein
MLKRVLFMLGFFARFQKGILLVTAFAIIASMAFFGTYSTLESSSKMKRSYRSEGIDQRAINDADLRAISLFLEADAAVPDSRGEPLFLLKHNWFSQNLIETGIAQKIIAAHGAVVQKPLIKRIHEHREFKMYTHPQDHSISLEKSIGQFFPDFSEKYSSFMKGDSKDLQSDVGALFGLYRIAAKIPMTWMKQILYYEQMQKGQSIEVDRNLEHRDINLFRAQKMSDWFGPNIVDLLSQWVYNTSLYARGSESYRGFTGIRVSHKEAEASLGVLVRRNIKRTAGQQKIELTADQMIERLARNHGLLKEQLVAGWQKIMILRRFFHNVGNVSVNSNMFKHLIKDAKIAKLETFELDDSLKTDSFYKVAKIDTYLNELSTSHDERFGLNDLHDMQELEKMKSFLLAKRFKVRYAKTNVTQAAQEIAITEIFTFQISDRGFSFLQKHSSGLKQCSQSDKAEREKALKTLSKQERARLDELSSVEILKDRQDLIRDMLVDQEMQELEFYKTNSEQNQILAGIFHVEDLVELLNRSSKDEEGRQALFCYSQDDENYYRFELVKEFDQEILTFNKANKLGILDHILDQRLRPEYLRLREQKAKLKNEGGSFKTYPEAKDFVAYSTFKDLVDSIVSVSNIKEPSESVVARHYFDALVKVNLNALKKNGFKPLKRGALQEQFELHSANRSVKESDPSHDTSVFSKKQDGFVLSFDDYAYVYKRLSVEDDKEKFEGARREARRMLGNEAKMNAAYKVLDKMKIVKVALYDQEG